MNILLLSYGIIEYDGRLIEIKKIAERLGTVNLVCCSINDNKYLKVKPEEYLSPKNFIKFLLQGIKIAKSQKKIDILIVDNYFSAPLARIIRKICKVDFIVQDARELYFPEEMSGRGKYLIKSEAKLYKVADLVFVANKYRAKLIQKRYNLSKLPEVFENIRYLPSINNFDEANKKYSEVFNAKYNIVSTGGVSLSRETDKLVLRMKKLSDDYKLYIIGGGTDGDINKIKEIIEANTITNVVLLDKVPISELKYMLQYCQIGIVQYHKNNLNNKYCASGKIYEFLGEGLPVVTSENIPLKDFCETFKVGVSNENFDEGILKIVSNYEFYKNNALNTAAAHDSNKYNQEIINIIQKKYNEKFSPKNRKSN